jgi:hypothetical protein
VPFLANPQVAGFYPPNWLHAVLPAVWVFNLLTLVHAVLPAVGAVMLARRRGASRWAAALAAVIVGFSGPMLARIYAGHVTMLAAAAWLPLGLVMLDQLAWGPKVRRGPFVLLSLVVALVCLAGHPQMAFLSAVVMAAWLFFRAWERPSNVPPPSQNRLVWIGLAGLLGIALAALQLVPTAAFVAESGRQTLTHADRGTYSLPLFHLWGFLYPGRFLEADPRRFWGAWYPWETTVFVGYPALLLAGVGGLAWGRRLRPVIAPACLATLILLLGLGQSTPLFEVIGRLPGFSWFRGPAKILLFLPLPLALLAARGLDLVRAWQRRRSSLLGGLLLAFVGCGTAAILFGLGQVSPAQVPALMAHLVDPAQPGLLAQRSADPQLQQAVSEGAQAAAVTASVLLVLTVLALSGLWIAPVRWRFPALGAVLGVQLLQMPLALSWTAATIAPPVSPFRSLPLLSESRVVLRDPTLTANAFLNTGFGSPEGYDPLYPRRYDELLNAAEGRSRWSFVGGRPALDPIPLLAIQGVSHGWTAQGAVALPFPGRRATLHQQVQWAPDEDTAWIVLAQRLARLAPSTPDQGPPVVVAPDQRWLSEPPMFQPDLERRVLQVESDPLNPHHVRIRIDPPTSGVLVLRDTLMAGWSAWADGRPLPIQPAQVAYRAVVLRSPAALVEFRYVPPGRWLGLVISGLGLVGLVVVQIRWSRVRSG